MKIIYVDESGTFSDGFTEAIARTNKRLSSYFILSAVIVDIDDWEKVLGRFKSLRADLRHNYLVKKSEHIHAYEVIGGGGVWRHIKYAHLNSTKRQSMFEYLLKSYAAWSELKVVTVVVKKLTPYSSINPDTAREKAYENLFNRIDKTLDHENYIVINDGQEDDKIIRLLRKLRAYNKLSTSYAGTLDVRIKSLVEDPLFKYSKNSYFLQYVVHVAYATLHIFDDRLSPLVGKALMQSGLYQKAGIAAVHRNTQDLMPGVVIVPKMNKSDIETIQKRVLA